MNHNKAPWALINTLKSLIRHSRLPAGKPGMPYGFVRIFLYFFLFCRRQGFRIITFDRQAGPLQNFNRSHVMVIGRSVSCSDPARPPGGAWAPPNTPKSPLRKKKFSREKKLYFFWRFKTPGRCFCEKNISVTKNI